MSITEELIKLPLNVRKFPKLNSEDFYKTDKDREFFKIKIDETYEATPKFFSLIKEIDEHIDRVVKQNRHPNKFCKAKLTYNSLLHKPKPKPNNRDQNKLRIAMFGNSRTYSRKTH
jgi:hypothetical protein